MGKTMSDEHPTDSSVRTEPVRRGWPKGKPRTASSEATSAPSSEKPTVQVTNRRSDALARRLAPGGNVHGGGVRRIPLKEPARWQLYIANDYAGDDMLYRMVNEYGWLPLEAADLDCAPEQIGYRVNETGHLVKGPRGSEVIFKMAIEDYRELQKVKTEKNLQGIGSPSKTRAQMAEAAATSFGDEAGEYVHKHVTGTVTDTRESRP
jgi:hypothetical protein